MKKNCNVKASWSVSEVVSQRLQPTEKLMVFLFKPPARYVLEMGRKSWNDDSECIVQRIISENGKRPYTSD